MDQETFSAVDEFVAATLVADDEVLEGAMRAAEAAGLPSIQVSPPQGKLLQLRLRLVGARAVLEFGTIGGEVVEIRVGPALDSLPALDRKGAGASDTSPGLRRPRSRPSDSRATMDS